MDGAVTGQFEQHLRAVLGLPLGDASLATGVVVMKNILGGDNAELYSAYPAALQAEPAAKIHTYGKSVRPGRKIGHVNAIALPGDTTAQVRERAERAAAILRDGRDPRKEA
jgi:5-(carboxyamino)imidazole ribonucleotide synthase